MDQNTQKRQDWLKLFQQQKERQDDLREPFFNSELIIGLVLIGILFFSIGYSI